MHSGSWIFRMVLPAVLLTSGVIGCGSSSESSSVVESPNVGAKAEKLVTAAAGGEVAIADAGIKISIPAGALSKDTTITAEVVSKKGLADASQLAGNVVVFGPDGQTFDKPVSLELDLAGATIPTGATVALAWYDEAKKAWTDLPGSKMASGKVTADTTHFTMFAVRFVVNAAGKVVQESGQCSGTFKACGGDLKGTWNITSGCADFGSQLPNTSAQCAGASLSVGLDITGDVVITADTITGTLMMTSEITQVMPKSCLGPAGAACPKADTSKPNGMVYTDKGATCEGKQSEAKSNDVNEKYTTSGSTIETSGGSADAGASSTADGGTGKSDTTEYCVTGNTLQVSSTSSDGTGYRWTATRK